MIDVGKVQYWWRKCI